MRLRSNVFDKHVILLGCVLLIAWCIRILYVRHIIMTPLFYGLAVDGEIYDKIALHIVNHRTLPAEFIFFNPLYPLFLAAVYAIFGAQVHGALIAQAMIDTVNVLLVYTLGAYLFNRAVGLGAALIYALYGMIIFYIGLVLPPIIGICCVLTLMLLLVYATQKKKIGFFLAAGLCGGLVLLYRPNSVIFFILLPLWFATIVRGRLKVRRALAAFFLFVIGIACVVVTISFVNYQVGGVGTPFSVQGGINFYIGNNPHAQGVYMSPYGVSRAPLKQVQTAIEMAQAEVEHDLTPYDASRFWLERGVAYVRHNPLESAALYFRKFLLFWRHAEIPVNISYEHSRSLIPLLEFPLFSFGLIAPFAIMGMVLSRKRLYSTLAVLFIVTYMGSVVLFFIAGRYRLPVVPLLIIYAAYAVHRMVRMVRRGMYRKVGTVLVGLSCLFVLVYYPFTYLEAFPAGEIARLHHNNVGVIYLRLGRIGEAIHEFDRSIAINPNSFEAYTNLGNAYYVRGQKQTALACYEKAVTINPHDGLAYYNLGNLYVDLGRTEDAIGAYEKVLEVYPHDMQAMYNLIVTYHKAGEKDKALTLYQKASLLDTENFAPLKALVREERSP